MNFETEKRIARYFILFVGFLALLFVWVFVDWANAIAAFVGSVLGVVLANKVAKKKGY